MEVVTRIAPSPTGDPHVGTAYIGLFNYVFARRHGGRFIFRLEDTDRQRYQAGAEARILEMFAWLGLQPDESPEVGGPNGPYRQSERLAVYHAHVEELLAAGRAYRAFETAEEIEAMRLEQKRLGKPIGYDGRGRDLPPAEQARRHAAGEPNVVRLMTADEGATTFRDRLRGDVTIPNSEIRDPVLMKSDGYPTYHLANVVDDHLMGVTHVIRAEEWVTSTPIHVLLYRAFGWDLPEFIHMPLLRNPDRSKVSKRKLDTSVDSYRQQGFLPEALLNFLANMGWSMPDGREYFGVKDMTAEFDIDRVSLGGPVFDLKKLRSFNAKYLRDILPLEEVAERAKPLLEDEGYDCSDEDYLLDVIDVLRPRAETLVELVDQAGYFFRETLRYDESARKQLASGQTFLQDIERELSILEFFDYDGVDDMLRDYVQEQAVPMGKVLMPLRAALTGTTNAPGVTDLIVILGKRESLKRIGQALTFIDAGLPDDDPQRLLEEEKARKAAAEEARKSRVKSVGAPPEAAAAGGKGSR
ncbi:MAG: glutamate--tRNA ligase [Trueperaceae bacterium]|jgi:glutamyl-tRNA synthetase|nr:glutamate--tRNA ligase [Trueperaceae bacterium]MCC6311423.1 glutamate--tRNA ligase [Trueperaceae bacterium]MCO5174088.1 glutamate--tRNA ligase [Trueperaceae bacterium]